MDAKKNLNQNVNIEVSNEINDKEVSIEKKEVQSFGDIRSEFQASALKLQERLQGEVNKIKKFSLKGDPKNEVSNLISGLALTLCDQLSDINQNVVKFQKEISERVLALENYLTARKNIFIESSVDKIDDEIDDEDKALIEDSREEELPMIEGEVDKDDKNSTKVYLLKLSQSSLDFRKATRKVTQQEIGIHKAFFERIEATNGDVAYQVWKQIKDFDMQLFLKSKLANIKRHFKKEGGSSGNGDHYFVMKFNEKQIQFQKKLDTRFDKFGLSNFYSQIDDNKFSIYVPSEKDRNRRVKLEDPAKKKPNLKEQDNNEGLEDKFIQFMNKALDRFSGTQRPQQRFKGRRPQYKKQYNAPPRNIYNNNQRRYNQNPPRNNYNNRNNKRVNELYDEIETLKKENNYLRRPNDNRNRNRSWNRNGNGNGYGYDNRRPPPFRSSPYW